MVHRKKYFLVDVRQLICSHSLLKLDEKVRISKFTTPPFCCWCCPGYGCVWEWRSVICVVGVVKGAYCVGCEL
jgi:hypothetical protein